MRRIDFRGSSAVVAPLLILAAMVLVLATSATEGRAQLVTVRTVPVSQSHQFEIFPSQRLSMGGISIAVADSLLDPFVNPARGQRIQALQFFGSPLTYSVSRELGGGRTLPFGALRKNGEWYSGLVAALQQVDYADNPFPRQIFFDCVGCGPEGGDLPRSDRSHENAYVFGLLGRDLRDRGLSVGGSLLWARLGAVDGVDLLYAGSDRVLQRGYSVDARLGLSRDRDARSLAGVLLYNRFDMTHDVYYRDIIWDPAARQPVQRPRLERNLDRTHTWGVHLEYDQPLVDGWRLGGIGTVNYKWHPKIPNYEIMNIPRDPGHSTGLNLGLGLARREANVTFGIDAIYEPIWSYTWADTEEPIETTSGALIDAGGKTVENWFRFHNAVLRMGLGDEFELGGPATALGLQLGLSMRRMSYRLAQENHVDVSTRTQKEWWLEFAPSWGASLRRPLWELRYRGRFLEGTGRPSTFATTCTRGCGVLRQALVGSDIVVAPSGPLNLTPVTVWTHQVSVSVPIH